MIEKGDHIAVVGAGLSGITATASLLDLGYSVTLYEQGKEVMNRQASAYHRYIHPSVNWWPDRPVVETTTVPYFDWISARCTDLIAELRKQWSVLRDEAEGLNFVPAVRVVDFRDTPDGKNVGVATNPTPCKGTGELYRAVLVTSGFSDENYRDRESFPGYWDPDRLEKEIDAPKEPGSCEDQTYIVSGCGDGGLIDALRIAHRDFGEGRLIVDMARMLESRSWEHLPLIGDAERELADNELRMKDAIDNGSPELETVYTSAAMALPPDVLERLDRSLRIDRGINFVTLLSRERNPYTPMAAPIHKLLLAHAMRRMVVRHLCCLVVDYSRTEVMIAPCGTEPSAAASAPVSPLGGHVILRHGALPNFRSFFPDKSEVVEELIKRQKLLAANLDEAHWSFGREPLKSWPPATSFAVELNQRSGQAASLVSRIAGPASGTLHLDEMAGFMFEYRGDAATDLRLGQLPDKLFGFPLKSHRRNELPPKETRACGARAKSKSPPADCIAPGLPIFSALNGRLGPIFEDAEGRLLSVTARHLAPSADGTPLAVKDDRGHTIGRFSDDEEIAMHAHRDIGLVALDRGLAISPRYGGHPAITAVVEPLDVFAKEVTVTRRDGRNSVGYVSSTLTPVYFRHPGSDRKIYVRDAVRIRSRDPSSPFADIGDSGAPVIDEEGRLLGIVVSNDEEFTYVLPIGDVVRDLGLRLVVTRRAARRGRKSEESAFQDLYASTLRLYAQANRRNQDEPLLVLDDSINGEERT